MSRLELRSPNQAQLVVEGLYKDLERRIDQARQGYVRLICPEHFWRSVMHRAVESVFHVV